MAASGKVIWIRTDIKQRLNYLRATGQSRCGLISDLLDIYEVLLSQEGVSPTKEAGGKNNDRESSKART